MRWRERLLRVPDGAGVANAPVSVRSAADGSTVGASVTDAGGWWDVQGDGHPGPAQAVVYAPGGATRFVSGQPTGLVGAYCLDEIAPVLASWGDGYLPQSSGSPYAEASARRDTVTVTKGASLVDGSVAVLQSDVTYDLTGAADGRRTVVWRKNRTGPSAGRVSLVVKPVSDPDVPFAPERTESVWESVVGHLFHIGADTYWQREAQPVLADFSQALPTLVHSFGVGLTGDAGGYQSMLWEFWDTDGVWLYPGVVYDAAVWAVAESRNANHYVKVGIGTSDAAASVTDVAQSNPGASSSNPQALVSVRRAAVTAPSLGNLVYVRVWGPPDGDVGVLVTMRPRR